MITVGLDFGTHQTKVCIEERSNKFRPIYHFFPFENLNGEKQFILPSVIQINTDNTISYGFVDESNAKCDYIRREENQLQAPSMAEVLDLLKKEPQKTNLPPKPDMGNRFENMYAVIQWQEKMKSIESDYKQLHAQWQKQYLEVYNRYKKAKVEYDLKLSSKKEERCIFRYFKIYSFSASDGWPYKDNFDPDTLSIMYLTYIILLLEKIYGQEFSIQMGIPSGNHVLERKRQKAVRLLLSAYRLAEDIFKGDIDSYLSAKYEDIRQHVELLPYSDEKKEDYFIRIFPEAYAGLFILTKQKRIERGMNLMIDIGGGTTDISFFEVPQEEPIIYDYESIPSGINDLVGSSLPEGVDIFSQKISFDSGKLDKWKRESAILNYQMHIWRYVQKLIEKVRKEFKQSKINIPIERLDNALRRRPVIYSGGGSMYEELRNKIESFDDVHHMNDADWDRFFVEDFDRIRNICPVLCVALGLSIYAKSDEIETHALEDLFKHLVETNDSGYTEEYGLIDT